MVSLLLSLISGRVVGLVLVHRMHVTHRQVRRLLLPLRNQLATDFLTAAGEGDDEAVSDDALTWLQLRAV